MNATAKQPRRQKGKAKEPIDLAELGITFEEAEQYMQLAALSRGDFDHAVKAASAEWDGDADDDQDQNFTAKVLRIAGDKNNKKTTTFRSKNRSLADTATAMLEAEQPMTLRQLFYRLVSADVIRNKPTEYKRLGAVMTRLREAGDVPALLAGRSH